MTASSWTRSFSRRAPRGGCRNSRYGGIDGRCRSLAIRTIFSYSCIGELSKSNRKWVIAEDGVNIFLNDWSNQLGWWMDGGEFYDDDMGRGDGWKKGVKLKETYKECIANNPWRCWAPSLYFEESSNALSCRYPLKPEICWVDSPILATKRYLDADGRITS